MDEHQPASDRAWLRRVDRRPPRRRRKRQLTLAEREEISRGVATGDSCRLLARRLGRAPSTINRELARKVADARIGRTSPTPPPSAATEAVQARRRRTAAPGGRPAPQAGLVPAADRGTLGRGFPDDKAMRVSHQTIYLTLFVPASGALRRELAGALRTAPAMRHPGGQRLP